MIVRFNYAPPSFDSVVEFALVVQAEEYTIVFIWAVSDNGSTGALQVSSRSSILLRSTKFFNASLAQLGERDTVTVEVRGSKPLRGAKFMGQKDNSVKNLFCIV